MAVSSIVDAISELSVAQSAYREAQEKYEGYSWGWAGYEYRRRVEDAEKNLEEALNSYIDKRISLALGGAAGSSDEEG
jgi:hypothetical protein